MAPSLPPPAPPSLPHPQAELQALQPQLVRTVGEVESLMRVIAREKEEVVEPKVRGGGMAGRLAVGWRWAVGGLAICR